MIAEILMPVALALSLASVPTDSQERSAVPPAAVARAADEPVIEASLWFISFEPRVPASKLPIDPRAAERMGLGYGQGADGRIPTWGLASQMPMEKLEITDGPHRLICREGRVLSETAADRKGELPPPWQIVTAPRIVVALNQQGMVSVGKPIQYLAKDKSGCLKVEESAGMMEGVELKLTASKILPEGIRFTGIALKFCRVTGRQPIDGVPFDVGRPIIDTRETSLDITLDNGRLAVIPLPQGENEPALLVFLTARVVEAAK